MQNAVPILAGMRMHVHKQKYCPFHPKRSIRKDNAPMENCSGGVCVSANVHSFPADVRSFSRRKLAKSCQIKVSAHFAFFRSNSETSKRNAQSPKTEDPSIYIYIYVCACVCYTHIYILYTYIHILTSVYIYICVHIAF